MELSSWKVSNLTEPAIQKGAAKTPMRESVNEMGSKSQFVSPAGIGGRCDQRRIPCLYLYSPYRNRTSASHKAKKSDL